MNLASMVKLAKGGMKLEDAGEFLAAAGIDMKIESVEIGPDAFIPLGRAASLPSAKMAELKGKLKSGESFTALIVLNQKS